MSEQETAGGPPVSGCPAAQVRQKKARNILVRSRLPGGGYAANPYTGCAHACRYCYASFMDRYAAHPEPWGEYVDVKEWAELGGPARLAGQQVFLSSVTDPYQPVEETYGRTRALLEELRGSGCRLSILTKSDLVLRDLDLICEFPDAVVAWSVNTLDEGFRADMDRGASIKKRLEAMQTFHAAGVKAACFIAPIFPAITDLPPLFAALRGRCSEIWLDKLNLRGPNRRTVLEYVHMHWPGLTPLYESIYCGGDASYWEELNGQIERLAADHPARVQSFLRAG